MQRTSGGEDMYVITGATGNTGTRIANALLDAGQKVRAVGRSEERLRPLVQKRAKPFVGSVDDPAAMTRAFAGAKAVYLLIPPIYWAEDGRAFINTVSQTYAKAIENTRVRYIVSLSSAYAHSPEFSPVQGLYDHEKRLNHLENVNVIHLRPGVFMENLNWNIPTIKEHGVIASAYKPDVPIPMIATKDIAAEAIALLLSLDFSGKSARALLGQRDVSMAETTEILGNAISRKLTYVQLSYDEVEQGMVKAGFSRDFARRVVSAQRGANEATMPVCEPRSSKNTTPTSLEEFARDFAQAYREHTHK